MLVVSRYENESILIGQHVLVRILEVRRHSVRLGIEAPRIIPIMRTELLARSVQDQLHQEKKILEELLY